MKELQFDIQRFNIYGTNGNDSIYNIADNIYINSDSGNDSIRNFGGYVTIYGSYGNDSIFNFGNNVSINGGNSDDNDTIYNDGNNVSIEGGYGDDSIYNTSNNVTIDGGNGNDTITNYNSFVSIKGHDGYDVIYNVGDNVTIDAGYNNDSIYNDSGDNSSINLGYGNDSIFSRDGDNLTLDGGYGEDRITGNYWGSKIYGGPDNDYLYIAGGSNNTIYGEDGNDTIIANGGVIYGGNNNDFISLASGGTIDAGYGDDTIYGNSYAILYKYYGRGYDVIYNWSSNDTLSISDTSINYTPYITETSFATSISGSDFIISVYLGAITLSGAVGKTININGTTYLTNNNSGTLLNGTSNGDVVLNNGSRTTINANAGNDSITNTADSVSINGGDGADSIYSSNNTSLTINGGAGDDTIVGKYWNSQIYGGAGADKISLNGDVDTTTINAGTGNDTIYMDNYDGYNYIQYSSGDGNDVIYYLQNQDIISLGGGIYTRETLNGNVIVNVIGSGTMTLFGASDKTINIVGGTLSLPAAFTNGADYYSNSKASTVLNALSGNDTVINSASNVTINGESGADSISNSGQSAVINGGADNDTVINSASYVTIIGGSSNDSVSLSSSAYNNVIKYSSGDGYDTVYGYDSNDTISLGGGYYTRSTVGNNVVVSLVSGGAITLSGANGKTINIVGGTLSLPAAFTNGADYYSNSKASTVLNALSGNDTVINSASNVTINGESDSDSISNSGQSAIINGGADNDTVINSASYVTIIGGASNDSVSLSSSAYNNVIKYSSGDGYDTVYGVDSNDTISITSGSYTTTTSGNDVIVKVGSGSITLKDAKGKTLNIYPTLKPAVTQQEVIKKFMGVLDTVTSSGVAALNQAVSIASGGLYGNVYDAIDAMVDECRTSKNANDFLLNYCGIDLSNIDTGAITGADAGGKEKNATSIVPESGNVTNFTGNSFNIDGLNVKLVSLNMDSTGRLYGTNSINYNTLSNDTQKYIWRAFRTWWAEGALDLISESYGSNYSFTSNSSATTNVLEFGFFTAYTSTLAATWPWHHYKQGTSELDTQKITKLTLGINMNYYSSVEDGNVNGQRGNLSSFYLDRVIAHEMTHAVMMANIDYLEDLPQFITEGMAELTHGIDDERNDDIEDLAGSWVYLKRSLSLNPGTGDCPLYASGYMFLRWLAKKSSEYSAIPSSQLGTTGSNLASQALGGNGSYSDITINSDTVTVAKSFNGNKINLPLFDSTVTKVDATKLTNGIWIIGNEKANTINAGSGADSISGNTGNDLIIGGSGNDVIMGDAGNDTLKGDAGKDTVNGGSGKNNLTGGAGNDIFVHNGGNDLITDYEAGKDKIQLANDYLSNYSISSSDVIFTTMNGTITVSGGKDKKITIIDQDGKETTTIYGGDTLPAGISVKSSLVTAASTFKGNKIDLADYPKATKVNAAAVSQGVSIIGSAANNSLKGGKGADTISGGSGNDTVSLGGGKDIYIYSSGNDYIQDYTAGADKIKLTSGSISGASVSSSNVILNISNGGKIIVKGGKDKEITVIDSKDKETTKIYGGSDIDTLPVGISIKNSIVTAASTFTGNKIDLADYSKATKVNTAAVSQAVSIVGSAANNSLTGGKGADNINGGAGKDTLYGGSGNDKIYGGNDNDKLYGDAGNDSLFGGSGNDTLTGCDGKDVFVYEGGKDVITDYTAGQDKIKISSGKISKTTYKNKDVVFTIGDGTLTVKNAKGKEISVTTGSQTQTYSQTFDLLYDCNFMTDELQIDDVSSISDTNYSVGQINYSNDNDKFVTGSIVSVAYLDKK